MTDTPIPQTKHDAIMDHDVIVFSKTRCVQCDQTTRLLLRNGINFHEMGLENDDVRLTDQKYKTAYEFVTQTLGAQAAPVVMVKNNRLSKKIDATVYGNFVFWTGFRPDFIKAIN